jgi:rifampicin phosphotransferase
MLPVMRSTIVPLERVSASERSGLIQYGGKAVRLAWLREHGFRIPQTWVISSKWFRDALATLRPGHEPRSLLRIRATNLLHQRCAEAHAAITSVALPRDLEHALLNAPELEMALAEGLAVRSSATQEDGARISMAGVAETILCVKTRRELVHAVREVWASLCTARSISYLAEKGVRDVSMAVLIQPMVSSRAGGVLFTVAPGRSKQASELPLRLVNATLGLAVHVTDGTETPWSAFLRHDGSIEEEAGRNSPSVGAPLSTQDLFALSTFAAAIEATGDKTSSRGWDVEFCFDSQGLVILQARSSTSSVFPEGGTTETIWSSANVGEALPGVATPLTWSVAREFSQQGFRQAFETLGAKVPRRAKLVTTIHGRIYLNITEFVQIASGVPWLSPQAILELGGLQKEDVNAQLFPVGRESRFSPQAWLGAPLTLSRLIGEQLTLGHRVAAFQEEAKRYLEQHRAFDLGVLPDEGLGKKMLQAQKFLGKTGELMLQCAASSLGSHLLLRKALKVAAVESIAGEVLATGIPELESAGPARALIELAGEIAKNPALRASLEESVVQNRADSGLLLHLRSFLELYGDRSIREAELSTPRWREDPLPVLHALHAMVQVAGEVTRKDATAAPQTTDLAGLLGMLRKRALQPLVAATKGYAGQRETMRALVTRALGVLRDIALEANQRLLSLMPELGEDALFENGPAPVFFLHIDELADILKNARTDATSTVRGRAQEYARNLARPALPHTFRGAVPAYQVPTSSAAELRGLAASPGAASGVVRKVSSAAQLGQIGRGDVLVFRAADVGFTTIFPLAAAVVTEVGGALSHAAVVARELGVPMVVAVPDALARLADGERVFVSGDEGRVVRLGAGGGG